MGQLRPQPRRVDARQARRAGTRGRVPGVCAGGCMRIYERGIRRRLPAMLQAGRGSSSPTASSSRFPGLPPSCGGGDRAFGRPRARWQGGGANADAMGQRAQRWFLVGTGSASRLTRPGRRPVRSRTRHRRVSASRSRVAAQLDGADDPPAQGVSRNRLGDADPPQHRRRMRLRAPLRLGRSLLFAHNLAFEPKVVELARRCRGHRTARGPVERRTGRATGTRTALELDASGYRWFQIVQRDR